MPMSQIDMVVLVPPDHAELQVCGDFDPEVPASPSPAEVHVAIRQGDVIARGSAELRGTRWRVHIDRRTGLTEGPAIACAVAFLEKDPAGLETLSWVQRVHIKEGGGRRPEDESTRFHFPEPESSTSARGTVGDDRSVSSSLAIFEQAGPQGEAALSWQRESSIRAVEFAEVDSSPSAE